MLIVTVVSSLTPLVVADVTIQYSPSAPQKEVDLAAATAVGKCDDHGGSNAVGINVTDTTMNAPSNLNWADRDTCVLLFWFVFSLKKKPNCFESLVYPVDNDNLACNITGCCC
jgi:hypothetical protein